MLHIVKGTAALTLLASVAFSQTTWYVDVGGFPPGNGSPGNPFTSLQYAIQQPAVLSGDTLSVAPGTYFENVDFLGKDLLVVSQMGAATTVIDGGGSGSVVVAQSGETPACLLEGFTVQGGAGSPGLADPSMGGGVRVGGFSSLTMRDCVVQQNVAQLGGGLAQDFNSGLLTLEDCVVEDNTATGSGGGFYGQLFFQLVATRCTFQRNTAAVSGGGLVVFDAQATLDQCSIAENSASVRGGGCLASEATTGTQLDLLSCSVRDNELLAFNVLGAGVVYDEARGTISDSTFSGNMAGDDFYDGKGGALAVLGGFAQFSSPVLVQDTLFRNNFANGSGGGAYCSPGTFSGHATFVRCTFQGNGAQFGGGLFADIAPVVVEDSLFTQNGGFGTGTADFGGGVYGPADVTRSEFDANIISGEGGGAWGANLVECDLHHNQARAPDCGIPGIGGAAYQCTLIDCTVWKNEAQGDLCGYEPALGAGIARGSAERCAIWGNRAVDGPLVSEGGGAWLATLVRCTVYDNEADDGAGVWGGSVEHCTVYDNIGQGVRAAGAVHNSIVRENSGAEIVASGPVTYCNVQGGLPGLGNFDAPEIFWQPDPGPEGTGRDFHFASASSPGVDAGDPASPLDPDGSRADLGPFPWDPGWCPEPAVYCTAKTTTQGCEASIGTAGMPTLSGPDDFHVTAIDVLSQKPGLFFWGLGPAVLSFQGGTLCVQPPLKRTPVQTSGGGPGNTCLGAYDHAFTQAAMAADGLTAGAAVYGQYWFRDPADLVHGIGLSNAVWWITCQ